jgi:hypothetical protein
MALDSYDDEPEQTLLIIARRVLHHHGVCIWRNGVGIQGWHMFDFTACLHLVRRCNGRLYWTNMGLWHYQPDAWSDCLHCRLAAPVLADPHRGCRCNCWFMNGRHFTLANGGGSGSEQS